MLETYEVRNSILALQLGFISVVVGTSRQMCEATLETSLLGRSFGCQAQVPLAGHQSEIASIVEKLWQGYDSLVQISFVARHATLWSG